MDDEQWCTVNWLNSWKIGWIGYCALLSQGLIVKCRYASARIPSSFTSFFSYSFSFSSSSFNFCQQQRLMQKVRRLSAGALWSISFNPLHLSSLPPPLSLSSVPLQSASLAFLLLFLFVLPLVHILLGLTCWLDANLFMELPFPPSASIHHHRQNFSNKSFTSQISKTSQDQQPGKMLCPRNLLHIHKILRHKVEKHLVQYKTL